jgi:2,4-dienoyl-CoA reductase-like NADH-dependent reductase (Old Yellow Enzyme family)
MPSALFTPIHVRKLTLKNRIVISPLCQYSAAVHRTALTPSTAFFNRLLGGNNAALSQFCLER